ncbi:MAG: hypothetical protein ABIQ44_14385 [Chloroflexia bacterium]
MGRVARLHGLGVRSKSERLSQMAAYWHRTRRRSEQERSASGSPSSWPPIIEALHRAARGGWRGTVRKQPRSAMRGILIAVIATAAVLGTLLWVLWMGATSTGTVPL